MNHCGRVFKVDFHFEDIVDATGLADGAFGEGVKTSDDIEEFFINQALAKAAEGLTQIGRQGVDVLFRALHGGEAARIFTGQ